MSPRRRLPLPAFVIGTAPLYERDIPMRVAFRDCDPMGVLWHGNYLGYCEEARNQLGEHLGFTIGRIQAMGFMAPVVRSQVLHHHPARPEEMITVSIGLYRTAQPRLYHRYRLYNHQQLLLAEAETEQVFVDNDFRIVLTQSPELSELINPEDAAL